MPRETAVTIRMSFEEKETLKAIAKAEGLPLSEFLRDVALGTHTEKPPVPFETQHDSENKAKARQAVENEEPYEVKIEPGTVVAEKDQGIEREPWIASTARILMMEKGLSKVAATIQATKEWEAAHD